MAGTAAFLLLVAPLPLGCRIRAEGGVREEGVAAGLAVDGGQACARKQRLQGLVLGGIVAVRLHHHRIDLQCAEHMWLSVEAHCACLHRQGQVVLKAGQAEAARRASEMVCRARETRAALADLDSGEVQRGEDLELRALNIQAEEVNGGDCQAAEGGTGGRSWAGQCVVGGHVAGKGLASPAPAICSALSSGEGAAL